MKYTIQPIWKDINANPAERSATCVILAGGPSLRGYEMNFWVDLCSRVKCFITINDSWRLLLGNTQAVNYFCDSAWWSMQMQKNPRSMNNERSFHDMIYKGNWITSSNAPEFIDHPQVKVVKITGQQGLELNPIGIRHGSNSGYQAINIATHLGAKRIILLGYDMNVEANRTNWHNEPRLPASAYLDVIRRSMLPHYPSLVEPLKAVGVEVINATPNSALTCFPKMSLEDALNLPTLDPKIEEIKAWKNHLSSPKSETLDDIFQHAIPNDEHINEFRKRAGLEPYPTKQDAIPDEGSPPLVWEGEMDDRRS
jgi:hypothetical protein